MGDTLLRLFPPPAAACELQGLYLGHGLQRQPAPFLYTNFIASLDGRISLPDPATGLRAVPAAIANPRDWRLYLELAAQADLLLTTGRHLRAVAAGRHQDLLTLDAGLIAWREQQGLPRYPDLAAVSEGLAIPIEARERYPGRLLAVTGGHAPPAPAARLRAAGVEVIRLEGAAALDAAALVRALGARGYGRIYSIAGARVTHALLAAGVVSRLYLTLALAALGGRDFDALTRGEALAPPARFVPHELYLDGATDACAQLFASFEPSPPRAARTASHPGPA